MNSAPLGSISIDPAATMAGILKLLSYAILFFLAVQIGHAPHQAAHLLKTIAVATSGYALYGLLIYALGDQTLLWFVKRDYVGSLTGTFVNRGAFAAYCGMGFFVLATLFLRTLCRELETTRPARSPDVTAIYVLPRVWLLLSGAGLIFVALLLTNARAGLASVLLAGAVYWLGLYTTRLLPRRLLLTLALLAATLTGLALTFHGDRLFARLEGSIMARDERSEIWNVTARMIADAPLSGQGLGTYAHLYPTYRSENLQMTYTQAHNTYLEMAAELGLPATALWLFALLALGIRLLIGVATRRINQLYPLLALVVLTQAALHSLLDFSFQIPANAGLLAILLGLGYAQSFRRQEQPL